MKLKDYYDERLQDPPSKDDWIEVTPNKIKNSKVCNRNLYLIPHTANKFELITNLKEESGTSKYFKQQRSCKHRKPPRNDKKHPVSEKFKKEKHKVLTTGDSHARKCATLLQDIRGITMKFPVL
jgi:hypothetical protein